MGAGLDGGLCEPVEPASPMGGRFHPGVRDVRDRSLSVVLSAALRTF